MGVNQDTVIRDIVFDAPLDESLFSFTPPKDYTEMGKAVADDGSLIEAIKLAVQFVKNRLRP